MADTPAVKPPAAPPAAPPVESPPDWQERRDAQIAEYGTWVATQPIYVGNALAYDTGHPVPVSNVQRHGYDADGLVAKRTSKEGKAALGQD